MATIRAKILALHRIELDEAAVMAALYPRHVVSAEITGSDR